MKQEQERERTSSRQDRELRKVRQMPFSQLERELLKVKQLSKCCGRQGETIHRLRAELAEVRELNSKIDRGRLRRLERDNADYAEAIKEWEAICVELREKLRAAESMLVVDAEVVEVEADS
jgi:hypothetical protein